MSYVVHYTAPHPARYTRLQLAIRIVAFFALGVAGVSFGAIFLLLYVGLPVYAAGRLSSRDAESYRREDGAQVLKVLSWLTAIFAWAGLVAEKLPTRSPDETVSLSVDGTAHPTSGSALWRVVTGLPSALVLSFLFWIGGFVWIWAALSVVFAERVGPHAFSYLAGLQRWTVRLLVYQASLVDDYPPFSFADETPPALPARTDS